MSSRNVRLYLDDILQACQDIIDFTSGMISAEDFENDRRTMLAVIRSLEVIGEAARQTPKRISEAAEAAKFLQALAVYLEEPLRLLV